MEPVFKGSAKMGHFLAEFSPSKEPTGFPLLASKPWFMGLFSQSTAFDEKVLYRAPTVLLQKQSPFGVFMGRDP